MSCPSQFPPGYTLLQSLQCLVFPGKSLAQPRWAQEWVAFRYAAPKKPSRGFSCSATTDSRNSQLPVCPWAQGLELGRGHTQSSVTEPRGKGNSARQQCQEHWVQGIPTESQANSDFSQKTPRNRTGGKGSAAEMDLYSSGQRKGVDLLGSRVPSMFSNREKSIWECWE